MNIYDQHIYLYAKNHYISTNPIDDLIVIISKKYGYECDIEDVYRCLLYLTTPYLKNSRHVVSFIDDLNPSNWWKVGGPNIHSGELKIVNNHAEIIQYYFYKSVIMKCLSVLALTNKSEYIDGGLDIKADPEILPTRK
jgi:hypothetical protein